MSTQEQQKCPACGTSAGSSCGAGTASVTRTSCGAALPLRQGPVISLADLGGKGDGSFLNTALLQQALDQCGQAGGGTVVIPAGTWCSGPVMMSSHTTLILEEGAILRGDARDPLFVPAYIGAPAQAQIGRASCRERV